MKEFSITKLEGLEAPMDFSGMFYHAGRILGGGLRIGGPFIPLLGRARFRPF